MRHFVHSGDLGDVIYSLPAVKAMGGGIIHLCDIEGLRTAHGMSRERFDSIAPLLRAQPYIREVRPDFEPYPGDPPTIPIIDLNEFRRRNVDLCNEWLPNHYLDVLGIDRGATVEPWLRTGDTFRYGAIVFARSARYRNPRFPWRRVIERYGPHAVFLGTPTEHAAFNAEFGSDIPYVQTASLLDAAKVIAGADLFVGNQSCPLAIAEGLKKPIVCEVCPDCPNCNSPRPGFIQGWDENFRLPDLEELTHAVQERGPTPVHARQSP